MACPELLLALAALNCNRTHVIREKDEVHGLERFQTSEREGNDMKGRLRLRFSTW